MPSEEIEEFGPNEKRKAAQVFALLSDFFSRARSVLKNNISPKLYFNLLLLFVISLIPWVSESSVNNQVYAEIRKFSDPLDPIRAGELTERFSKYTPGLEENAEDVTISMMISSDNYTLAQQLAVNANKDLKAPERQEATYIVKSGETITQIAQKFDLHVQSILDANDIKPEDTKKIKEGYILNIPSSDTSTSNDWLVAIKKAEDDARARSAAEAAKRAQEAAKKKLAASRALAATTKKTASGYDSVDNSGLITPLSHRGISQYFGRGHTGVDYMANVGTPVMAAAGGKVVIISSGWSGGYGNQIVIDHGGGRATRYAHLSSFNVSSGETVSKGQVIAMSGNTGRSTGPHLHFELIIGGRPVNPL